MIDKKIGFSGEIMISKSKNNRSLYNHQKEAIKLLNKTSDIQNYKGLLVIPTGGGKTFTCVYWIMNQVIDKGMKVLWIAHRHELLNQTIDTVINKASFKDIVPNRSSFRYRIISGSHDRPVNIREDDDFIISSKDSLNRGSEYLENWVKANKNNICIVIDEAHHAVAKTYRNIINIVEKHSDEKIKIIGLTATPMRTSEKEKGLLKKLVFKDDICYSVDLNTLIAEGILSKPVFYDIETHTEIKKELTAKELNGINNADILPEKIVKSIIENKGRNNVIVEEYVRKKDKYGKTLVFAVNVEHAIVLNALFRERNIKSDFVVSALKDLKTHATISNEENARKINSFRNGDIDVLINVNILTEGTDIPNIETVFLTRPTTSTILLNQMIGRGLRGIKAGGTEKVYIVSFIDDWKYKINWVSSKNLPEYGYYVEGSPARKKYEQNLIDIKLIEDFAKYIDKDIKVNKNENKEYDKFEVIGAYIFTIDDENFNLERSCQVIVFEHLKSAYEEFIDSLDYIFNNKFKVTYELEEEKLYELLLPYVKQKYFAGYDLSFGYNEDDIKNIVLYYQITDLKPLFTKIEIEKKVYIDRKEIESPIVIRDEFDFEKLSMSQIKELDVYTWRKLRDEVFKKYKDEEGYYISASGKYKSKSKRYFHIDHIIPISKGGKTKIDNLQLLTSWENWEKGSKTLDENNKEENMPIDYLEEQLKYNYFENMDLDYCKSVINEILDQDENNIMVLNVLADISLEEEKFTKSIIYANKVLKIDTKNSFALSVKGLAYIKKNNYEEAIKALQLSIESYENPYIINRLADCYKAIKKKDMALYYYTKALEVDIELQVLDEETIAFINNDIASIYFSKRKYELAKKGYEKYLEVYPNDENITNNIGTCYDRLGNLEEALKYFKKANSLNPTYEVFKENINKIKERLEK